MIPNIKLNNGKQIPQVGLGIWQMHEEHECKQAVKWALQAGYRHFDTAQYYANEQFLGEALKESGVARDEVFVTTKIRVDNFTAGRLARSFDESLKKLQMEAVDLLLLQFPVPMLRDGAWRKLEEIYGEGRAKSIGVSNYTIRHLEHLLKNCSVRPAVNQIEVHVFLQQPELIKYCQDNDIAVVAYSPLAQGQGMDNPVLVDIAKKHGKTPAQIMLRWCIEQNLVIIPKSVHQERIRQNINIFDFKLDEADKAKLKQLDSNHHMGRNPAYIP